MNNTIRGSYDSEPVNKKSEKRRAEILEFLRQTTLFGIDRRSFGLPPKQ